MFRKPRLTIAYCSNDYPLIRPMDKEDDEREYVELEEEIRVYFTFGYEDSTGQNPAGLIVIPKGFATDFNSRPAIFGALIPQMCKETNGATALHDWLYCTHIFTREIADLFLLKMMEWKKVSWLRRSAYYQAVRWFGESKFAHSTQSIKQELRLLDMENPKLLKRLWKELRLDGVDTIKPIDKIGIYVLNISKGIVYA